MCSSRSEGGDGDDGYAVWALVGVPAGGGDHGEGLEPVSHGAVDAFCELGE